MADILVVDDDPNLAETMRDLLEIEGHTVRLALDGQSGLDALGDRLPDLVILDIEMPVLDGPGMAHRMLVENAGREKVPILLASGFADLCLVVARVGTPYFVAKPCDVDDLLGMVGRALTEHMPPKPRFGIEGSGAEME